MEERRDGGILVTEDLRPVMETLERIHLATRIAKIVRSGKWCDKKADALRSRANAIRLQQKQAFTRSKEKEAERAQIEGSHVYPDIPRARDRQRMTHLARETAGLERKATDLRRKADRLTDRADILQLGHIVRPYETHKIVVWPRGGD